MSENASRWASTSGSSQLREMRREVGESVGAIGGAARPVGHPPVGEMEAPGRAHPHLAQPAGERAPVLGAAIGLVQLAGPADASRTDGSCGGVGVYDPVTQQCQ